MLGRIRRALMSPVVGLIATAVAFALAVTLGVVANVWEEQRAEYEARITALRQASGHVQAGLRDELATCQLVAQARQAPPSGDVAGTGATPGAQRLLERQPEGIDACARMESADRAVLSNLPR